MTKSHLTPEQVIEQNLNLIDAKDSKGLVKPLIDKNYPELIMNAPDQTTIATLITELIDKLEINYTRDAGPFDNEVSEIKTAINELGTKRIAKLKNIIK